MCHTIIYGDREIDDVAGLRKVCPVVVSAWGDYQPSENECLCNVDIRETAASNGKRITVDEADSMLWKMESTE